MGEPPQVRWRASSPGSGCCARLVTIPASSRPSPRSSPPKRRCHDPLPRPSHPAGGVAQATASPPAYNAGKRRHGNRWRGPPRNAPTSEHAMTTIVAIEHIHMIKSDICSPTTSASGPRWRLKSVTPKNNPPHQRGQSPGRHVRVDLIPMSGRRCQFIRAMTSRHEIRAMSTHGNRTKGDQQDSTRRSRQLAGPAVGIMGLSGPSTGSRQE